LNLRSDINCFHLDLLRGGLRYIIGYDRIIISRCTKK
jgi:hypothetical protein